MNIFFYEGPISRAVAFEGVLDIGQRFAERLLGAFSEDTRPWPELVHIATDGEICGHYHWRAEMALAFALNYIETKDLAELINYSLYQEWHPPTHCFEIFENSSWSCVHGVERLRSTSRSSAALEGGRRRAKSRRYVRLGGKRWPNYGFLWRLTGSSSTRNFASSTHGRWWITSTSLV
jgi:hypothetical protein